MAQWEYTLHWGKQLREAICAEDEEFVVRCLIACYRELLNKLSDEDKDCYALDIEDAIFNLESFDEDEDVDDYLEYFYDLCDDVRAWIAS